MTFQMPGGKVFIRLIDALESLVGGVFRPWQTRRVERSNIESRVLERLLLEQAELDIIELRAGRKMINNRGKLVACEVHYPLMLEDFEDITNEPAKQPIPVIESLAIAAHSDAQIQAMQRAINLKRIALFAEEEADAIDAKHTSSTKEEKAHEQLDKDWFMKWKSGAEDVSREEMQRLWAKLLAGEVSEPGTYSLHTIDFLTKISQDDASLIASVAPFATNGGLVVLPTDFYERAGISVKNLMDLDDMGFINGLSGGGLTYTLGKMEHKGRLSQNLICNQSVLVFDLGESSNHARPLVVNVYSLSRVGREILSLASFPANESYLQAIADHAIAMGAVEVQKGLRHPDGVHIVGLHTIARRPAGH